MNINLSYPIKVDGVEVTTLTLRRPTLRDEIIFADSKASDGKKILNLLASLTGVSPDELLELDGSDSDRLMQAYADMKNEGKEADPLD